MIDSKLYDLNCFSLIRTPPFISLDAQRNEPKKGTRQKAFSFASAALCRESRNSLRSDSRDSLSVTSGARRAFCTGFQARADHDYPDGNDLLDLSFHSPRPHYSHWKSPEGARLFRIRIAACLSGVELREFRNSRKRRCDRGSRLFVWACFFGPFFARAKKGQGNNNQHR